MAQTSMAPSICQPFHGSSLAAAVTFRQGTRIFPTKYAGFSTNCSPVATCRRLAVSVNCKSNKKKANAKKQKKYHARGGSMKQAHPIDDDFDSQPAQHSRGNGTLKSLQACRTLVLDCSYRPIDVVNWQRAVCLDIFDKADVLEYYKEPTVHASTSEHSVPAVMRVRFYVNNNRSEIPCARRYVMIRDDFECQYCGSTRDLTMDHVHPVSKGGEWSWTNLVTCCSSCNSKKGNRTLADLGWKLKKKPKAPSPFEIQVVAGMTRRDLDQPPPEWGDYLFTRQMPQQVYPAL